MKTDSPYDRGDIHINKNDKVLVESGVGKALANMLQMIDLPLLPAAFIIQCPFVMVVCLSLTQFFFQNLQCFFNSLITFVYDQVSIFLVEYASLFEKVK